MFDRFLKKSLSQLSRNNKPDKKAMWIDCGIHAREWISPAFCLWFVRHVSTVASLTDCRQSTERSERKMPSTMRTTEV